VGNAVSPPCVAAVAKKTVGMLFLTMDSSVDSSGRTEDMDCPVFDLLLQSSSYPDKVVAAIKNKVTSGWIAAR